MSSKIVVSLNITTFSWQCLISETKHSQNYMRTTGKVLLHHRCCDIDQGTEEEEVAVDKLHHS